MLKILSALVQSKVITEKGIMSDTHQYKLPLVRFKHQCEETCRACITNCLPKALSTEGVDPLRCIFCYRCLDVCPENRVELTDVAVVLNDVIADESVRKSREKIKQLCKGSLHIRYVDAGACNACDFEINALPNPIYDIQQYGIDFVASPRHADMLLVTGVVSRNLEIALMKTYEACPKPTLVVAVGSCACGGGVFQEGYAVGGGVNKFLPVDVYVPGCPPSPPLIIEGILAALSKKDQNSLK